MNQKGYIPVSYAQDGFFAKETVFDVRYLGKCESIFTQGNGYLGLRNSTEESYTTNSRGLFINGAFHKSEGEVSELVNLPDVVNLQITVNGVRFSLETGICTDYERRLSLKEGEVVRRGEWESPIGDKIAFCFKRIVSMADFHIIAMTAEITPLSGDMEIEIISGIDAAVTNNGTQHFYPPVFRNFKNGVKRAELTTYGKDFTACITLGRRFWRGGIEDSQSGTVDASSRTIMERTCFNVKQGQSMLSYRVADVRYSRERGKKNAHLPMEELGMQNVECMLKKGYDTIKAESAGVWEKRWEACDISIKSENPADQAMVRMALYHLNIMTNAEDDRLGIGAKGLTGEGYKGHSFWDTEMFTLPFYIYTFPNAAKSLLTYRYHTLNRAKEKAQEYGYEGAMYPWESAWIDDGETCPVLGELDLETGQSRKNLMGEIEVHISADIAHGVKTYYEITKDADFMQDYGIELVAETALFWASRAEWNQERERYEICNVIGPDEFKEEIDNNAYTNYMAYENMGYALELCKTDRRFLTAEQLEKIRTVYESLYLPSPDANGIIPQDDTYLSLKQMNTDCYRKQGVGSIFKDYGMESIRNMQISKQADLVMLLFALRDQFKEEEIKNNLAYYEARTLHDSSLSQCVHAIMAAQTKNTRMAYDMFLKGSQIDFGKNPKSSDDGIHTASIGGIWMMAVFGFGGLRIQNGAVKLSPAMPKGWKQMTFPFIYENQKYQAVVKGDQSYKIEKS